MEILGGDFLGKMSWEERDSRHITSSQKIIMYTQNFDLASQNSQYNRKIHLTSCRSSEIGRVSMAEKNVNSKESDDVLRLT